MCINEGVVTNNKFSRVNTVIVLKEGQKGSPNGVKDTEVILYPSRPSPKSKYVKVFLKDNK